MGAIFSFIANILGYVLNFIYNLVNNYGLAVILFTIALKVIMMPYNIKQQKTMKKNQEIQAKVTEIQNKYSNDPVRQNQEVMDLYKREGVSPMSGCLSSLVTLFIFISIFYLVSRPLTFMRHVDSEKIAEYTKKLTEQETTEVKEENNNINNTIAENVTENVVVENTINEAVENKEEKSEEVKEDSKENDQEENKEEEKRAKNYVEIAIIREFGEEDKDVYLNMNFLGLNLSDIPSENLTNPKVFIIPILYVITTMVSMKLTRNLTKASKPEEKKEEKIEENPDAKELVKQDKDEQAAAMEEMSKTMTMMMPVMSVMISMIAPLGLALYWFVSNLFSIAERLITNMITKKPKEE